MSSSDVTSVTKYFSTAAEGFNTTLSSTISASATSVGLNSTSGLTNGAVFVGIIEPGQTAQQTFTGTVDVSGSQITNVVWVRGSNVGHAAGVSIVDYVSGAAHNMATAGILKQHTQAGAHTGITTDTVATTSNVTVGGTLGVTGVATFTAVPLLPANTVETADIQNAAVTADKLSTGAQTATIATNQSSTSTSYGDLSTVGPSVTVTIGANGLALVIISARFDNDTSGKATFMSWAASGANTIAAADTQYLFSVFPASYSMCASRSYLATGLTPGSTTFTAKYKVDGGTGDWQTRYISVIPL